MTLEISEVANLPTKHGNFKIQTFKEEHKDKDWKLEMMNIELNKLGQEGWEMVSQNGPNSIYLKRKI